MTDRQPDIPPFTEEDVKLVADAIDEQFLERTLDVWPSFEPEARAVLEALAAAGRLVAPIDREVPGTP